MGITGENSFDANHDLKSADFDRYKYDGKTRLQVE